MFWIQLNNKGQTYTLDHLTLYAPLASAFAYPSVSQEYTLTETALITHRNDITRSGGRSSFQWSARVTRQLLSYHGDRGKGPSQADQGAGPSRAVSTQEEESGTEVIVQSLSMKDLQNIRKDFSCHEGETLITCCSDPGIMGPIT